MTIIQKLFGLYFFKIIASPDLCFTYPCKCLCIIYLLSFYLSIGVNGLIVDTCDSTVHICLQTPRTILLYHSIVEICIYVIFFYVNTLPLLISSIQVYDIVRYRIHRAKKKVKDELEDRNTVQEYICPNGGCGRRSVSGPYYPGKHVRLNYIHHM